MLRARVLIVAGCLLALLGCDRAQEHSKLIVLGIDGLDPVTTDLLMSEGKLPNFARLRQEGAYGRLKSMEPMLSPIIWTTIATGKPPSEHKIGHFVTVNQATGEQLPVTSRMRGVHALWNILSAAGKQVGVVGWWATWPAEHVNGVIVSDHTCYHFLFEEGGKGAPDTTGVIYPPDIAPEIFEHVRRPGDLTHAEVKKFADVSEEELARPFHFDDDLAEFKWALATAESYSDIGAHLWNTRHPDVLMVYIEGVDSSSHLFGHLFRAHGLAGELADQQRRYGETVERMYQFADSILGRYLSLLDSDTNLVVLSDHGFQLGELQSDPSKTRDMRRVSERFHRIQGVLYMYGPGVKAGARIDGAEVLDVAPTLLALTGMPVAADMPGHVLTEALRLRAEPKRVPTYETGETTTADAGSAKPASDIAPVDPAILEHLRALGYLDTASPTGDRNLASLHFEAGRYREAAEAYRKLIAEKPDDGALHASLAGTLGAMGDYDGALTELGEAEKLSPLNPEIYHNRGVILERRGKTEEAIEQYRRAVRYSPDYEPSRSALQRLTGSADPSAPRTDAEKLAATMAERAGNAARHGDYASAMQQLDEAERIAPSYALVQQYRANVAFLMGDRARATAALEKALEIEPDNALYKSNLARLKDTGTARGAAPAAPPPNAVPAAKPAQP